MSANVKGNKLGDDFPENDLVQRAMGDFGRWQAAICVSISFLKVSVAWHQLAILFLAPPQDFWCARPPGLSNISVEWWRNHSSPRGMSSGACERYNFTEQDLISGLDEVSITDLAVIPCSAWEFDSSVFSRTIVADWDLVCGHEMLAHVAQTVFMFGILAGNFIFGVIADRHGRKGPLLFAVALQVVSGVGTAFCTNFSLFLALRFFDAFATGGSMVTSFVIGMELVGRKWRAFVAVMYHIPFSLGHLTLPGLAYIFPNWRQFQLAISLPSLILLSYYWIVPESPRWLLTVGRVDDAAKILKTAARINKLPPSVVSDMLAQREQLNLDSTKSEKKASFLDLLKFPNLRTKTLCIAFNWLVCGVCFFGLAQYMGQIAGNIFINVAAGGIIEVPGSFICIYAMERFGRRNTLIGSQLVAGIACLSVVFVPQGDGAPVWVVVALSTVGIVGMSVAFPTVYLFSGELFPTVVRNVGVGFASMCARIGSMAAPFISGLRSYSSILPPLLFGVFPLIGCLLCLLLPETMNTVLPDTIEEGEACGKATTKKNQGLTGIENSNFKDDGFDGTKL